MVLNEFLELLMLFLQKKKKKEQVFGVSVGIALNL